MEEKRFLAWGQRGRQGIGPLARGEPLAKGREASKPQPSKPQAMSGPWLD